MTIKKKSTMRHNVSCSTHLWKRGERERETDRFGLYPTTNNNQKKKEKFCLE